MLQLLLLLGSLLLLVCLTTASAAATTSRSGAFVRVSSSFHQREHLPFATISSPSLSWITTQV